MRRIWLALGALALLMLGAVASWRSPASACPATIEMMVRRGNVRRRDRGIGGALDLAANWRDVPPSRDPSRALAGS